MNFSYLYIEIVHHVEGVINFLESGNNSQVKNLANYLIQLS